MALGETEEFDYLEDNLSEIEKEVEEKEKKQEMALPAIKPVSQKKDEEETEKEETQEEEKEEEKDNFETDSNIYIVKVTTNKEKKSIELISDRVKKKNINIYSVVRPHGLRGYIILEAPDKENAEEAVFNLPYVKGIIPKQVSYEEVKSMIEPRASEVNIEKNDVVEIISDTFKNEKAKVVRIDKTKGEAVVSLLAAVVPIPVTVKLDNLRVIRREEGEE